MDKIHRCSRWIANEVQNEAIFIAALCVMNIPLIENLWSNASAWVLIRSGVVQGLKNFALLVLIAVLLRRFPRCVKRFFEAAAIIMSAVMLMLNQFAFQTLGGMLNIGMAEALLATTTHEALEFLEAYLTAHTVICLFLFIVIVFLGGVFLYRILKKSARYPLATLTCLAVGLASFIQCTIKNPEIFVDELSIGQGIRVFYQAYRVLGDHENVLVKMRAYRPEITHNKGEAQYIVYILGESGSRHRMGIYGYHLDTTPRMGKRLEDGKLYVFTDVVSPHSQTIEVLKKLYTFHRTGLDGEWMDYGNLFSILRAAGYHTAWLSNQEYSGKYGNVARCYAELCDEMHFTVIADREDNLPRGKDEQVLPFLDEMLAKAGKEKCFAVIHLMGEHCTYKDRYPDVYSKFNENDEMGKEKRTQAEYDNAVLYNDTVVDEIIQRFEDKDAIIVYAPDHGEEVCEEGDYFGHYEGRGTRYMMEIPMVVWTSSIFKEKHAELEKRIAAAVQRPYMTDDMIHTLMDLAGVETPEYDAGKSIINASFDAGRPRWFAGKLYVNGTFR